MSETNVPDSSSWSIEIPESCCPDHYDTCGDLGIVACYFNPLNYKTKLANFKIFEEVTRKSDIYLLTVECAFGDAEFHLSDFHNILKIRTPDVLWQKEWLINLAITKLPEQIKKVAWLDCDVLFANPRWAIMTSELLEEFPVIQPFRTAVRLPRGDLSYKGRGETWTSFGYVNTCSPESVSSDDYQLHGHTGFAWAARLDLLKKHGLYYSCISGGGDHLMAHAMCGNFDHPCLQRMLGANMRSHFLEWGRKFYIDVQSKVGYTPGTLLHLWHGETEDRKYAQKHDELLEQKFDPVIDLYVENGGALRWKSDNVNLRRWAVNYFQQRKEDGEV